MIEFIPFIQGFVFFVHDIDARISFEDWKDEGGVIEEIPLARVGPVFSLIEGRSDAGADRAEDHVDRIIVILTDAGGVVPDFGVGGSVRIALTGPAPDFLDGEMFDVGIVLDDPFGERTPGLAGLVDGVGFFVAAVAEVEAGDDGPGFVVVVRLPVDDVEGAGCAQFVHHFAKSAENGWMGFHDFVAPEDADLELLSV